MQGGCTTHANPPAVPHRFLVRSDQDPEPAGGELPRAG